MHYRKSLSYKHKEALFNKNYIFEQKTKNKFKKIHPDKDIIDTDNAFPALFLLGLLTGLPMTPSAAISSKIKLGRLVWAWCFFISIFKLIVSIVGLPYAYYLYPGISPKVTYYAFNLCGILTRILMILNREKIYAIAQDLRGFSIAIRPGKTIGIKGKWFQVAGFMFLNVLNFIIQYMYNNVLYQNVEQLQETIYVPSFIPKSKNKVFLRFVMLCPLASFLSSSAALSFTILVGVNIYKTVIDLEKAYRKYLRVIGKSETSERLYTAIKMFSNLSAIVNQADEAINWSVFFVYCAGFGAVFNTVSTIVTGTSNKSTEALINVTFVFIGISSIMILLSYCGTRISTECAFLKQLVKDYAFMFFQTSPKVSSQHAFNILFEMIMNTNFVITGGNMFVIDNSLILTILGVMVTYGVLMFQVELS